MFKNCFFGSAHADDQLSFSIVPSILTSAFDLFFLLLGALMGYFWVLLIPILLWFIKFHVV